MKPTLARCSLPLASLALCLSTSCLQHKVAIDPIEIEPIHITMDINVKVQRELDDFFDFEGEAASDETSAEPAIDPTSEPEGNK